MTIDKPTVSDTPRNVLGEDVVRLMDEWFSLKEAQKAKKRELVNFHEAYECTNMQPTDHNEYPTQCIYREISGHIPKDACDPCTKRHNYYLQRKENAHKRTQILNKVRHLVKKGNSK